MTQFPDKIQTFPDTRHSYQTYQPCGELMSVFAILLVVKINALVQRKRK